MENFHCMPDSKRSVKKSTEPTISDADRLNFLEKNRLCVLCMSDGTWEVGDREGFSSLREGIDANIMYAREVDKS